MLVMKENEQLNEIESKNETINKEVVVLKYS